MSFIGEAVLGASVQMLIEKLAPEGLELLTQHEKLKAEFFKWKGMLEMIQAVLADAEDRQTREKSVKKWLENLQNLAYDVQDILDEFQTEAFRREVLLEEPAAVDQSSASTSTFRKFTDSLKRKVTDAVAPRKIRKLFTSDSPRSSFNFESKMVSKIEEFTARLQAIISTQKDLLKLKNVISDGKSRNVRQRLPTTSLVNEAKVYGRKKDKDEIVELLLRDDSRADDGFSVISIIGMGGVGKTTLAQLVYKDDRVRRHFEIKAWTFVSEDFDVFRVTKSILMSISNVTVNDNDLNSLQEKLEKELIKKKFLLVLDDMWNENYNDWELLNRPFKAGTSGSKIIVTTRNRVVAERVGSVREYPLGELSKEDCLRVLTQHSLGATDFNTHQSLKEVREKIAMKCKGLPLAAKTLGGLLRGKHDPKDWEIVLNADVWDFADDGCDIIPALKVSYRFLPPQLKQCFAYCSLFPKDYEFEEEEIILLWTAEGFLDQECDGRKMEELGREFVRELHSRSLFHQSSKDASRFVMHSLINDLARWAAGEIYFRMEDTLKGENQKSFSKNLRHFSYILGEYDGEKRLKSICDGEHLRTFLPVKLSDYGGGFRARSRGYLAWSVLPMLLNLHR